MSISIDYISDLHLDSYCFDYSSYNELDYYNQFIKPFQKSEILIIAGDLGHNIGQIKVLFNLLCQSYKHILFCLGNHEYWYNTGKVKYKHYSEKISTLKKTICNNQTIFMDGNIFTYKDINIGGNTMWYDFSSAVSRGLHIKEFNNICNNYFIDPSKMGVVGKVDWNDWFYKEYIKCKNIIKDCDIYFSHVGPMEPINLPEKYNNFTTGFFYFNGKEFLKTERLKTWIFGHTHDIISETFDKGNKNFVNLHCNPIGYHSEFSDNRHVRTLLI